VIVDGLSSTSEESNVIVKRSTSISLWDRILSTTKRLAVGIKAVVLRILRKYQPEIIQALNNTGKILIKAGKDIFIEVGKSVVKIIISGKCVTSDGSPCQTTPYIGMYVEINDNIPRIAIFSDIWNKVKTAVSKFGSKAKAATNAIIEKYRPKIEKALQNAQKVIIVEGKKIVIEIVGDIVKVIVDGLSSTSEESTVVVKRSISSWWDKVKSAASNLGGNVRQSTLKVLEEFKPKIVNALNNVKKLVIQGAEQIVIEICGNIVKIIAGGDSATSSNIACPIGMKVEEIYVVLDDPSSVSTYSFSDIWTKVKRAVKNAGDKISKTSKILIKKYKPLIVEALKNIQKVAIDQGKSIIFDIVGDVVRVIVNGKISTSQE